MSIMYELELSDPIDDTQLKTALQAVATRRPVQEATESPELKGEGLSSGLEVEAYVHETSGTPVLSDAFGVEGAAEVGMEVARHRDYFPQLQDVIRVTMEVLNLNDGDAVLHYELGTVWLVRRNGRLVLSDRDDLWSPDLLDLVTIPYDRAPLVVP